jgi:steroid 5-alpha reductase family enzyme
MAASVVMAALWAWHLRTGNAGVVDAGWAASLAGMAVAYGVLGDGWPVRRWLVAGMMAAWGLRLTRYLWRDRVWRRPEDARYADLRRTWRTALPARFFAFFQVQALLAAALSLPVALAAVDPAPGVRWTEWIALALWIASLAGETIADRQLEQFKAGATQRGRVCRTGLWRYSRHPNYFFEWLVWVAYALAATASPWGALAWACPAVMLFLLFRITGIPATEAQALRSRGDAYRDYQRTTSVFVPWPPRTTA